MSVDDASHIPSKLRHDWRSLLECVREGDLPPLRASKLHSGKSRSKVCYSLAHS